MSTLENKIIAKNDRNATTSSPAVEHESDGGRIIISISSILLFLLIVSAINDEQAASFQCNLLRHGRCDMGR